MKEIELKILDIDKQAVIRRLEELGARKLYGGLMKVRYFDFPDERIRNADELLRARDLGDGRVEISYKYGRRVRQGMKILEELTAFAGGFEEISAIFAKIGLVSSRYYEKKRVSYTLLLPVFLKKQPTDEAESVKIEIDEYPHGFCYAEIEGKSREQIDRAISILGLEENEKTAETVDELFERKFGAGVLNEICFKKRI